MGYTHIVAAAVCVSQRACACACAETHVYPLTTLSCIWFAIGAWEIKIEFWSRPPGGFEETVDIRSALVEKQPSLW